MCVCVCVRVCVCGCGCACECVCLCVCVCLVYVPRENKMAPTRLLFIMHQVISPGPCTVHDLFWRCRCIASDCSIAREREREEEGARERESVRDEEKKSLRERKKDACYV